MAMAATARTALGLGACARPRRRSPGASPGMTRTFLAADASARGLSGVGAHGSARKIGGGVVRPGARRPARPVAALGPNEVNELAGTTLLTLSGFEAVLGKVSFGSLLAATSIYEYKAFFTDEKRAGKVEQAAMLGGNVALASLLAARWVESGHFPLSNMYESLLFLAWGITGVHLVVTERDGFSKSAVPGALSAPTALSTVAAATLALPAELQRASALVPALKSNWLMMHVSVMMLSYATLLVGSLSCMSFLVVDASQGWTGAKGALGFVEGMVTKDASAGATAEAAAAASAATAADVEAKVRQRNRPKVGGAGGGAGAAAVEFPLEPEVATGDRLLKEMDNLAYRCLGAGFALLTAGLISGAVWANEAWGSYWSWDPKETWALITWFTYATYLHSRLVAGKSKKETAIIGAAGFVVVWVCYVGVNLWGVGLHSYGWFANK